MSDDDWDERRMDIIGPNGNEGLHYEEGYEEQDYQNAKKVISQGFILDENRKTLELTETNVVDYARKLFALRKRSWDEYIKTNKPDISK